MITRDGSELLCNGSQPGAANPARRSVGRRNAGRKRDTLELASSSAVIVVDCAHGKGHQRQDTPY